MEVLITVVILVFIFGFLIFIHEAGHFVAAKMCGVQVDEFAFGFGPRIISKKIGTTEYKVNIFPLGGYVKMLGDTDGSSFTQDQSFKDNPKSYISKSIWQKMTIVVAGPLVNFVGAAIIFFVVLSMLGFKPDPIANIVDYNFIGASERKLIYYNFVSDDSPLRQEDIPSIGFVDNINGREVNSFVELNKLVNETKGNLVRVTLANSRQEKIHINFDKELLLDEKNPLGIALIDSKIFERMELSEYKDKTPIFYNGLLEKSPADLRELPEAGFILDIDDKTFNNAKEVEEYLKTNAGAEMNFSIMDINYNVEEYFVPTKEFKERSELFYVAIDPNGAGATAGIPNSGYILQFNDADVKTSEDLSKQLTENENKTVSIKIETLEGITETYQVELGAKTEDKVLLGVYFDAPGVEFQTLGLDASDLEKNIVETFYLVNYERMPVLSGLSHTFNVTGYQFLGLSKLIGDAFGGQPGLLVDSVGTPIKVGEVINAQVVNFRSDLINKEFMINLLDLTGLLSATLAFMNMLPIPLVDGGQFLLLIIEKLRGRPLSEKKQDLIGKIGFIFLIGFSIIVLLKDFWQVILSKFF